MFKPLGKLIPIGGNEDKGTEHEANFVQKNNLNFFELQILSRIVAETKGKDSYIEVITTASSIPEEVGENYLKAFDKLGCHNVKVIHIKNREDALNPDYIERIKACDGVLFTGGNQLRLSSIFGGTDILDILHDKYLNEKFVIAGTSAGGMAMSNTMIYHGSSHEAFMKGDVKITTGLAFIANVIIDSHFVTRGEKQTQAALLVERVGPRVGSRELQAVGQAFAGLKLQRVIVGDAFGPVQNGVHVIADIRDAARRVPCVFRRRVVRFLVEIQGSDSAI